jgi:hypothetical protein
MEDEVNEFGTRSRVPHQSSPFPTGPNKRTGYSTSVTSPNDERILPFLTEPWRRTAAFFNGCWKITGSGGMEKKKAAKILKEKITQISSSSLSSEHLLVYRWLLLELHRVRRVGAGVAITKDAVFFFWSWIVSQ